MGRTGLNTSTHRREQAVNLRQTGLSYAEIGRRLGITRERVRQIIKSETRAKKKPTPNDPDALLTPSQAAELLNIHTNTLRRWSNKGIVETYCIGTRGDRRFRRRDIDNLLMKKSIGSAS